MSVFITKLVCAHARKNIGTRLTFHARACNSIREIVIIVWEYFSYFLFIQRNQRRYGERILTWSEEPFRWLVLPAHCLHQTNVMHRQASGNELENYTKKQDENWEINLIWIVHFRIELITCLWCFSRCKKSLSFNLKLVCLAHVSSYEAGMKQTEIKLRLKIWKEKMFRTIIYKWS